LALDVVVKRISVDERTRYYARLAVDRTLPAITRNHFSASFLVANNAAREQT